MPDSTPAPRREGYVIFVALVASIGGFLFGYDLVIISGAQIFIRDQFQLTPAQFGFATSSALLGCVLGPTLGAWSSDRFGRKATLMFAAALFAGSAIGTALATDITSFNVWRIVGGVGVGLASLASPMYIAEIAPARRRGQLGLMYQLAITLGAVAAVLFAYYASLRLDPAVSWRWMLASVIVPVVPFALLLLRVPHSPRWLAAEGRFDEARQVLQQIDTPEEADDREMAEIRASLAQQGAGIRDVFAPGVRPALGVGIMLGILNNWTGWTGIAFYLPTIFQRAGFDNASDAIFQNAIVMAGNVVLTLVSISLVDRVGRRPLWITCSAAMAIGLTLVGMAFHYGVTGPIMVVIMFLCAAPHAMGLGALPWLMMSEIYPTRVRAKALSISTTCLWIAAFTGPAAFPILQAQSERMVGSIGGVFWLYAAICVFSVFWALKYLPETRGRTLEEIAASWKTKEAVR
jgi:sugar porter (SP) family MFS transporter